MLTEVPVVPAVGGAFDLRPVMLTIDMQIRYLGDAPGDGPGGQRGWIVKSGRSIVLCQAEVVAAPDGGLVPRGWLTYRVVAP